MQIWGWCILYAWKYTINRFLTSFVVIAALILDIVGVVAVHHLK